MSSLAGRTHAVGPTARQVTEGEAWAVEVDLNRIAADLLLDLARVIARKGFIAEFYSLAQRPTATAWLARITGDPDVQAALRIALHPDAAERLSSELYDSLTEPDTCRWREGECCNYVGTDLDYCDRHREGLDLLSEQTGRAL